MVEHDLVQDFVNTWDKLDAEDAFESPSALVAWLAARGLVDHGTSASPDDLEASRGLREALRALLLANNGVEADVEGAGAVLEAAARRAWLELRFEGGGSSLEPAVGGVAGALGRVVAAVHTAMADGSWSRLKACRARDCEWAFVDHAKNRSRAWCSMQVCGNREKVRSYRERHRSTA
jgi:predicted RNA-binding Zn ribbon-like protein